MITYTINLTPPPLYQYDEYTEYEECQSCGTSVPKHELEENASLSYRKLICDRCTDKIDAEIDDHLQDR